MASRETLGETTEPAAGSGGVTERLNEPLRSGREAPARAIGSRSEATFLLRSTREPLT
jgi:hypothetical protein